MTDEEKVKAVTAKIAGEFYVGQRVQHTAIKRCGVVVDPLDERRQVLVQWDGWKTLSAAPENLKPL